MPYWTEAATSTGTGAREHPLQDKAQAKDPTDTALSQLPQLEQARGNNFHRNKYKGPNTNIAVLSQGPPPKQAQGGNLS